MAKFTVSIPLRMQWRELNISGAAGATHRIPDAMYDEFVEDFVTDKPDAMPGLVWISIDEQTAVGGAHPDLATHDTLGLATQVELNAHTAAADPHTAYALDADLANHEAAADPHVVYQRESEKAAASGYASLNASTLVPVAQLGTGAADTTKFLRGDSSWQVPAGGSERAAASTTPAAVGTAAVGVGTTDARADHVHATGAGTPSTQAFADAAAAGAGPAAAMTDHKHAMPANPVTGHEAAVDPHTGYRLESADHTHASTGLQGGTVAYAVITGTPAAERAAASTAAAAVGTAGAVGVGTTDARADHVHAHELGHVAHDTIFDAAGDLVVGSGVDTAARLAIGTANQVLTVSGGSPIWASAAGGNDPRLLLQRLVAQADSTAIAPVKVTGLDRTLGVGTWIVEYFIRYRSSVATTGVKFDLNHSGTVTSFVWNQFFTGLIGTASDANADQDSILAAATVINAFASRAKGTAGRGVTVSVDTANLDMFMRIEGLIEVTVSGDIQLYFGSEATGSTQSVMVGSVGRFTQVA